MDEQWNHDRECSLRDQWPHERARQHHRLDDTDDFRGGSVVYLFDLGMGNPGSPLGMTYSGEHGENASNVVWDINNQSSNRGVSITVQTGSRYDHNTATPTLYAYLRTLSFDANGHLMAVGPESRVVIDTPESCP